MFNLLGLVRMGLLQTGRAHGAQREAVKESSCGTVLGAHNTVHSWLTSWDQPLALLRHWKYETAFMWRRDCAVSFGSVGSSELALPCSTRQHVSSSVNFGHVQTVSGSDKYETAFISELAVRPSMQPRSFRISEVRSSGRERGIKFFPFFSQLKLKQNTRIQPRTTMRYTYSKCLMMKRTSK